ncbi:MAG: transporter substrate-binding domain-containing protein [Eubacteriales bacterium]
MKNIFSRKKAAKWIILIVVFFTLLFPMGIFAESGNSEITKPLVFLGNQNLPPMVYLENGSPKGIVVDIVHALAEKMGRTIEIKAMNWAEAQKIVEQGGADALIQMNITEERKKIYDFSDPLLDSKFSIFTLTDTTGISGASDLRGLRVGVEAKGYPSVVLQSDSLIELVNTPSILDAFQMLKDGSVDAVIADEWVGEYILAENGIGGVFVTGDPIATLQSSIAVQKGDTELLAAINKGLEEIKADGTYQLILDDWKPAEVVFQTRDQIRLTQYEYGIGVLLLLVVMATVWGLILFRQLTKTKKMKHMLEEEHQRHNDTITGAKVGTWEWNVQTGETVFGVRWANIIGYTPEELYPSNFDVWKGYIHPEDLKLFETQTNLIFDGKADYYDVEYRMKHKAGHWVWVNIKGKVISWTNDGKPLLMSGISIEITERKQAEELLRSSRAQLTDIIQFLPDATLAIDKEKRIIIWNKAIEDMTGIPASDMLGKGDHIFTIPFYGEAREALVDLVLLSNEENAKRYTNLICEGDTVTAEVFCKALYNNKGAWIWAKASPLHDDDGNVIGAIEIIRDITGRRQAEDTLKESEEKYRLLTENASDVIWILNTRKRKFTYISPSIINLLGITAEEAMDERMETAFTPESFAVMSEAIARNVAYFAKHPKSTRSYINQIQEPCKNGNIIWVEISTKYRYNGEGDIEIVGVSRNIDERKKSENEILYMGYHDQLTGLYNRRFYEEELKRLDTARNLPLTLVMGDVNGLKIINDSFGHTMGDRLLVKVAELLRKGCRSDDIIARLGGDEFVAVLCKTDTAEAERIIARINDLLREEKIGSIDVSVSFGFETKHNEKENIQKIIKKADDHMYRHKLSESSVMRRRTIDLIMNTLFEKDNKEMLHAKRVSGICEALAKKMNFDQDDVNEARTAGLMHDIGKIGIDEKIFSSLQKLDSGEWKEIRRHSEIGYQILTSVNEFSEIAVDILAHHERWDGKGYPKGLAGEEIPLKARLIAIADAFDAITTGSPYRKAISKEDAINEIRRCSGTQFDPEIAKIFIEMVMQAEIGCDS